MLVDHLEVKNIDFTVSIMGIIAADSFLQLVPWVDRSSCEVVILGDGIADEGAFEYFGH